jgi:hypothetical protein
MDKHVFRSRNFRCVVAVTVSLGLTAGVVVAAVPAAEAATTGSAVSGPAPICWPFPKICVPQTWWVPTKVLTNDGLLQLLPTSVEANTTAKSTQMSQTVMVTGTLTATLTGDIPVAPSGIAASVNPGGQAQVSGSDAEQGTVQVPTHGVGYLKFGIVYEQVRGTAFFRNIDGTVTSAIEVATIPEGFGYVASDSAIQSASNSKAVVTKK